MKKVLVVMVLIYSGIFSLTFADCYLVYSSKVTSSLGGPGRYGPMSESKCNELKRQQDNVVDSSNVKCECTSGGGSSTSGYSGKNASQYQMIQGIGAGIQKGMENARLAEEQRAKEAKWKEEEAKKQEKLKNDKARSDWNQLKQKEAEATLKKEQVMKIRVNELLQQMGSSTGEMRIESIGGGTGFFGSDTLKPQSIVFKPIGDGEYGTSKILAIPEPPSPTPVSQEEAYQQKKKIITLEIEQNVKQLQEIKTKLYENNKKIKETEAVIKENQVKAVTKITPEKQKEQDRLVAEANALLVESNEEQIKLINEENKLQENIQEKNRELKEQSSTPQFKGEINEKR